MNKMTIDQEVKLWDQIKKVRNTLEDQEKYFSKGKKGFNSYCELIKAEIPDNCTLEYIKTQIKEDFDEFN